MKWIRDKTGRFLERPYYTTDELEDICEELIETFLKSRYGVVRYPIETSDLTVLAEQHTSDVDTGADLSEEGLDVQGVTIFLPDRKPEIRIDAQLTMQAWRANRLRTTLTHEIGHVRLHTPLWERKVMQGSLFSTKPFESAICSPRTILDAKQTDWMEWQAGYASGAMLMPRSALRAIATDVLGKRARPMLIETPGGENLLSAVQQAFRVSRDAARVRLLQRKLLHDHRIRNGVARSRERGT